MAQRMEEQLFREVKITLKNGEEGPVLKFGFMQNPFSIQGELSYFIKIYRSSRSL